MLPCSQAYLFISEAEQYFKENMQKRYFPMTQTTEELKTQENSILSPTQTPSTRSYPKFPGGQRMAHSARSSWISRLLRWIFLSNLEWRRSTLSLEDIRGCQGYGMCPFCGLRSAVSLTREGTAQPLLNQSDSIPQGKSA